MTATYTDGSQSDLRAGNGVVLAAGGLVEVVGNTQTLEAQGSIGIKWTSTKQAGNGEVDWSRWPLEGLIFYRDFKNHFRVGGGLSYQFDNQLKGSGVVSAVSTTFANALGEVFQGDYFFGERQGFALGLRCTKIRYSPSGSDLSIDGSSWGLSATYIF